MNEPSWICVYDQLPQDQDKVLVLVCRYCDPMHVKKELKIFEASFDYKRGWFIPDSTSAHVLYWRKRPIDPEINWNKFGINHEA